MSDKGVCYEGLPPYQKMATSAQKPKASFGNMVFRVCVVLGIAASLVILYLGTTCTDSVDMLDDGKSLDLFQAEEAISSAAHLLARQEHFETSPIAGFSYPLGNTGVTAATGQAPIQSSPASIETAGGSAGAMTGAAAEGSGYGPVGVSIPISTQTQTQTQTQLSTIYMISTPEPTTHTTMSLTSTRFITVTPSPSSASVSGMESDCTESTTTETVFITVLPQPSSGPGGDATVTGGPSTVTNIQTDISLTSGLSDATVSGNPSTVTEAQTEYSVTTGLPDATESGNPSTVTKMEASYYLTTVTSGTETLTTSEFGTPLSSGTATDKTTITATSTRKSTVTTTMTAQGESSSSSGGDETSTMVLTITDLWPSDFGTSAADAASYSPESSSTSSGAASITSTSTEVVIVTAGPPASSTNTVLIPYITGNGTIANTPTPYGTPSAVYGTPAPIVVSGGNLSANALGAGMVKLLLLVAAIMVSL